MSSKNIRITYVLATMMLVASVSYGQTGALTDVQPRGFPLPVFGVTEEVECFATGYVQNDTGTTIRASISLSVTYWNEDLNKMEDIVLVSSPAPELGSDDPAPSMTLGPGESTAPTGLRMSGIMVPIPSRHETGYYTVEATLNTVRVDDFGKVVAGTEKVIGKKRYGVFRIAWTPGDAPDDGQTGSPTPGNNPSGSPTQ